MWHEPVSQTAIEEVRHRLASPLAQLLDLPVFTAVGRNRPPADVLRGIWNYEAYAAIYSRCLANVLAQVDSERARMPLVENLWDEHGRGDPAGGHRLMMATFVSSVERAFHPEGIDRDPVLPSTTLAIRDLISLTCDQGPLRGMGALLALELTNASQLAALQRGLFAGLPDAADMTYLVVHQACDDQHAAEIAEGIDELCTDNRQLSKAVEGALAAMQADFAFWAGLSASLGLELAAK